MDTPEADKNKLPKRTNNNRMFILDEFLGVESGDLLSKEPLSFVSDLHQELEERKLYAFDEAEQKTYAEAETGPKEATHIDAWAQKKKRRGNSLFWMYPANEEDGESPVELPGYGRGPAEPKSQKLCLGVIKKFTVAQEKNTTNSILPLYLNATTSFEGPTQKAEFQKISANFIEKVDGIDYEALTVQQLKSIMKEFGLNYTGKKQELISRIHQTYQKILQKQEKEGLPNTELTVPSQPEQFEGTSPEEKIPHGFMFF